VKLSYGQDSFVSKWVLDRIPSLQGYPFGPCAAIAVVSEDGRMMAGVVFHDWQPVPRTMQISAAAVTARWATRGIVRQLLAYPFMTCGVQKVWTAIEHGNIRAIRFNEGIGIRAEARLQRHFGESDAVICRMFREEYLSRYQGDEHGQVSPVAAASA